MQLPGLSPTGQLHSPPGPQTIGPDGAASLTLAQSESVAHGFVGIAHMPQPVVTPPGLHWKPSVHSASEAHVAAPESPAQLMFDWVVCQLPPLHVVVVPQP